MPELDAEHRDQMADLLTDMDVLCGPWCNERRGTCRRLADSAADALAPLVAGWLADAWDEGARTATADYGIGEATNPYRGGDDG